MKLLLTLWCVILALVIGDRGSRSWAQESDMPERPSSSLIIAGSGSNLAITRVLAREFIRRHPEITLDIPASIGSKGGIRAVAEGAIDVGLASRPLNASK